MVKWVEHADQQHLLVGIVTPEVFDHHLPLPVVVLLPGRLSGLLLAQQEIELDVHGFFAPQLPDVVEHGQVRF